MQRILSVLLLLVVSAASLAQKAEPYTPGQILLGLQKLNTAGSVLYVAAHPDDENTRLLAWLSNDKKVRIGYLSLTRGDGGQNLIGPEQGEALGLIRTQELLAARRIDGAEQFFTRAYDFGFSKNPEETFSIWNRDSILADVVWVIRKFRPDVIITRFPTTGEGGHGHHTASAMLALEAFDAAADPTKFPEQLKDAGVWQAKRIFWNTFNFGGNNTTSPDQLQLEVGGYNALLGKSYGEIAAESRSMHKSQGFGTAAQRGTSVEYFKLLKGDSAKNDIFEGIDLTWKRYPNTQGIRRMIKKVISDFDASHPEHSMGPLLEIAKQVDCWKGTRETGVIFADKKIKDIENLALACAGLHLEALSGSPSVVQGAKKQATVQVLNRSNQIIKAGDVSFREYPATPKAECLIVKNSPGRYRLRDAGFYLIGSEKASILVKDKLHTDSITVSYDHGYTSMPYWLREPHTAGAFILPDQSLVGMPENNFSLPVQIRMFFPGANYSYEAMRQIVYKSTDPVKGERYRPLEILPPVTANFSEKSLAFDGLRAKKISIVIKAHGDSARGRLELTAPAGWKISIASPDFNLHTRGAETSIEATITPSATAHEGMLKAVMLVDGERYTNSIRRIEYDHIPPQFYLPQAEVKLVPVALKKTGINIGYIPGAGDDVPASLTQIGYNVTLLTDDMLATGNLAKYDAIVAGVRAYNVNDRLPRYYERLMAYVKGGGNFIVQYNTNTRLGPMTAKPGPYPFTVSSQRVTDEAAAVTFTNPAHPVLNFPNKITQADFTGWVQERGIYFASDIDKQYETVLAMNDKGEKPNEGSLIIGKYGKGNFVYTGLVFFRQLPAGNPGAYRLFVNLLSLPRNEGKK